MAVNVKAVATSKANKVRRGEVVNVPFAFMIQCSSLGMRGSLSVEDPQCIATPHACSSMAERLNEFLQVSSGKE